MIDIDELGVDIRPADTPPERPLKTWRTKFEANHLCAEDFMKFFEAASPFHLSIKLGIDISELGKGIFEEQSAKSSIIDVLEEFLCGDNPETLFEKIKQEGSVSSVCGRVFKGGEATYSCRECGMDKTCVLCVSCFKQSAHRHHKYKMGTSVGGGCCDCGDKEAWKSDPYCDEHITGSEHNLDSAIITTSMRERCAIAFDAILQYCIRSLEFEAEGSMRSLDESDEDVYCTVLYNDETHTFEQVIQVLTRIVGCIQKEAVDYVSSIDREGRAVVKCATFEQCVKLQTDIETSTFRSGLQPTKPVSLKVAVLHKNNIAYQHFALQLLGWFQDFLTRHTVFRKIFGEVAMKSGSVSHILLNDFKLWKTARSCWHRVLISGMLMEYENKKTLAVLFTRLYPTLMQDYIRDDHDHSFSVVSLSVQLFTVPTIAQHLISEESAFFKLMHTFYQESIEKHVKKKTLQFAKNTANHNVFKRASFILFDLKYILSFKPDIWTEDLRKSFLHGVQIFMKLLKEMQGMDSVHRQTGQHMEYEPEWESAFNLHIKLALVITHVLDWCSTDKVILVKVYRLVLASLSESEFIVAQAVNEVKELADHSASSLMYDVSSKHVSVHLPLSRFFAGLYLYLGKFDLTFDMLSLSTRPTPEQIIEPVLCTQTMIAQVHAGLWRRNGYSLLNQLYFYRNVKCRSEMLDRDITVLQIGASLIESNEFLIHVMNKFNLINWAAPDYEAKSLANPEEDGIRQISNMIDELLELLIVIIGERFSPGIGMVTEVDKMRKEIIQQLCIKPFSHSELHKSLPEMEHEMGIESVIDSVAIFQKPRRFDKKGVYELKPQYFDYYNMYFYHYTKEEKSKSEEAQRKRRKDNNDLMCCPPPTLPQLTPMFSMLANLLQCDVMLLVMQTVLKRALDLRARCFSETHLQKILHLIGYAIQEEQSGFYPFITFTDRAAKWDILPLMEELVSSVRVEAHRDLLIWTVKKYKDVYTVLNAEAVTAIESTESIESSMSGAEKQEKEERAKLAAERRAKIMAQMASAQKNFMTTNADLFGTTSASMHADKNMEWQDESSDKAIACLGVNRNHGQCLSEEFTCILCSEESMVNDEGSLMVYSAYIQPSDVLNHVNDLCASPHVGSCGHVMHAICWTKYFDNEVIKENRRPNRNRSPGSFQVDRKEFLCPLCRCLSNAVLPIAKTLGHYANEAVSSENEAINFEKWFKVMQKYNACLQEVQNFTEISEDHMDISMKLPDLHGIIEEFATVPQFQRICKPIERQVPSFQLQSYIEQFLDSIHRVVPYPHAAEECEPYLVTWMACSYTVESLEMCLRAMDKPLKGSMSIRHTSCLKGLVRMCGLLATSATDDIAAKLTIHLRSLLDTIFNNSGTSVIEWNIFKVLASLVFLTPTVIYLRTKECSVPSGNLLEFYFMKLMFAANIAKILILHNAQEEEEIFDEDMYEDMDQTIEESHVYNFYLKYNYYVAASRDDNDHEDNTIRKSSQRNIINVIKRESQSLLRCSSILFHFMTDIELPEQFSSLGGDTFESMTEYLGLSADIESYFKCDTLNEFMCQLAMHKSIAEFRRSDDPKAMETAVVPCISKIRQFIAVPEDYSDLINSVSNYQCPKNVRDDTRNPTLCLGCGRILCSMTYCCQRQVDSVMHGACTLHTMECGAGVSVFLRIRDCEILVLGKSKGSFLPAPYLDEYGETDQGLRRGNPLHLCRERLNKLQMLWLNHGLYEEIARYTDTNNALGVTQWHNM